MKLTSFWNNDNAEKPPKKDAGMIVEKLVRRDGEHKM
jgi:hypothetical protein